MNTSTSTISKESNSKQRITAFKEKSVELLKKGNSDAKNHYQDENSITVYLWLKYPDKYYIYKFSEAKAAAAKLESANTLVMTPT